MKFLIILMALLVSFASLAGVIKKSIPQAVLDKFPVGTGSIYIQSYDVKNFDLNSRTSTIKKWNTESGCSSWTTVNSVKDAITKLNENGGSELAFILEDLRVKNQLKAAVYSTSLPSNNLMDCSFFYYEFYSIDGDVLVMDLDFNK